MLYWCYCLVLLSYCWHQGAATAGPDASCAYANCGAGRYVNLTLFQQLNCSCADGPALACEMERACGECHAACLDCYGPLADMCYRCRPNSTEVSSSAGNGTLNGMLLRNSTLPVKTCCESGHYFDEKEMICKPCAGNASCPDKKFKIPKNVYIILGCGGTVALLICGMCACLCYFQCQQRRSGSAFITASINEKASSERTSASPRFSNSGRKKREERKLTKSLDTDNPLYMQSVSAQPPTPTFTPQALPSITEPSFSPSSFQPDESFADSTYITMVSADLKAIDPGSGDNRTSVLYCTVPQRRAVSFDSLRNKRIDKGQVSGTQQMQSAPAGQLSRISKESNEATELDNQYVLTVPEDQY